VGLREAVSEEDAGEDMTVVRPLRWTLAYLLVGVTVIAAATIALMQCSERPVDAEAPVEVRKQQRPVFPAEAKPCVRLLDLQVSVRAVRDAKEVVLGATIRFEGPGLETIDLTSVAATVDVMCADAIERALVATKLPPDALVCKWIVPEPVVAQPFEPIVIAFSLGEPRLEDDAVQKEFAAVNLAISLPPEFMQIFAGKGTKFVPFAVDSTLRTRPWVNPPLDKFKRYLTVIENDEPEAPAKPRGGTDCRTVFLILAAVAAILLSMTGILLLRRRRMSTTKS